MNGDPSSDRTGNGYLSALLCGFVFTLICAVTYADQKSRLQVGITLHPYYAYVSQVVGEHADVVPLIDTGFNPHNYTLSPADIARLQSMDVLVVNGIGHDEFAIEAVERLGLPDLQLLNANEDVPLLGTASSPNPHTFVSIDAAVRQVYSIAKGLSTLDPENAVAYRKNAFNFAKRLRGLKRPLQELLITNDISDVKIASTHNAYGYLLQEFGLTVSAVVEPAHGVLPSAAQLQKTIDTIRGLNVDVLFTELNMENSYVDTIEKETGIRLFHFSHMTHGEYSQDMVEVEMSHNLAKLREALMYAVSHRQ
ncbi:MAG: zinc ABC transporter substrate-binding protein [Pseudomonadota bacterium]